MCPDKLRELLAGITPQRMREIVPLLRSKRSTWLRSFVAVGDIVDALLGSVDLGQGPERGQAFEKVQLAIRDAVAQLPEMKYIYGNPHGTP